VNPAATSRHGQPLHLLVATLRARCLVYAVAPTFARSRTGRGRQHHRHAAVAVPAPAPTSRRRPSPLSACPFEPATPGKPREAIVWRLDAPALTSPPARPCHAAVALRDIPSNTLDHLRNRSGSLRARGTTRRSDRSRSAWIRCGPPLLSQATHRPSQNPAAPPIAGSRAGANGRPAAREPQGAGSHPIRNWRIRCGRGFLRVKPIFISRKSFLSLKNPNQSILTPKIVKPFPESF
jgi:hypothetical protein